jgi:hypothetical protein
MTLSILADAWKENGYVHLAHPAMALAKRMERWVSFS